MVRKRFKKSTLMGYHKDYLADLVMTAQHNEAVALENLEQQAQNLKDWEPVVHCWECENLMFSDCYGECKMGHLGIVSPNDYCSKGKRKEDKE